MITPISGDTLVSGVVTDIASLGHTCITTEVHAVLREVSFWKMKHLSFLQPI